MRNIDPDAHYILVCMFGAMREAHGPDADEVLRAFFERMRKYYGRKHDADIAKTIREFLTDADADMSEFARPEQLGDGGEHVRRCLATIAPWYLVYLHVRDRDVAALRRWYDEDRPGSELRDLVLLELGDIEPAHRCDAARVAFEGHPKAKWYASTLLAAIEMLVANEISSERFDLGVEVLVRRRRSRTQGADS